MWAYYRNNYGKLDSSNPLQDPNLTGIQSLN